MATNIIISNVQGSSREALRLSLLGILGPEGEARQAAEQKIQGLAIMEQYGIHLLEFILDTNYELAVRELAATNLKDYIEAHWDSAAHEFEPPEITLESKTMIKELLPVGLRDPNDQIRAAIVQSMFITAQWDWPENWLQLPEILVSCLNEDNEFSIHGALGVLSELTGDDFNETQIQHGSSIILQEMHRIYESKDQYSVKMRNEAVEIFTKLVSTISVSEQLDPNIQQYLEPAIPKFCKTFIETLRTENNFKNSNDLKMNVIKAIHMLVEKVPKCIADYLPEMLPLIWETLMDMSKVYLENTVNGANDTYKLINYDAITVFEFLSHWMTGHHGYELRIPNYNLPEYHWFYLLDNYIPPEALHHLINLLQITDKQITAWNNNVNAFIFHEALKFGFINIDNVRRGAEQLVMTIISNVERAAANSLIVVILKQLESEKLIRASGNAIRSENWWKSYETILLVFGLAKDIIIQRQKAGSLRFDIKDFLENVVLADLNNPESHPLLVGRCLCLGGIYADQLSPEIASRFLEPTIEILQRNGRSLKKLCAIKAAAHWYNHENSIRQNNKMIEILRSHLPALYQGLHNLGRQLLSREISVLVLQTVADLISFDKDFTYSIEHKICALTIDAFFEFRDEYLVCNVSGEIFKALTLTPECIGSLQRRLVPKLLSLMRDDDPKIKTKAVFEALEILVKHSPKPLSSLLIEKAFPACCEAITTVCVNDYSARRTAGDVIALYLSVAADQVTGYQNEEGKTGSQYVIDVVIHLLNVEGKITYCNNACKILISLIRAAGHTLGEDMDRLFTALLTALQETEPNSFSRRELLIVFAHIINTHFNKVFKFLTTAPDIKSQTALAFLFSHGFCKEYKLFLRDNDLKTAILALSKVLEHGLTNRDSPLHKITVQGPHPVSIETIGGKKVKALAIGTAPLLTTISNIITSYLTDCTEVSDKTK